jgi:hypothetical protein
MIDAKLQQEIILRSEDRVGILADVTRVLSEMRINILSVRVHATDEDVVVYLLTNSQSYADEALRDAGYALDHRDVVLVTLPHYPGFLRRATDALARRDISIYDLHVSVPEEASEGVVVLTCTNNAHAIQILRG